MTRDSRGISRRHALQILGGAGITGLAGCSSVASPFTGSDTQYGDSAVEPRDPPSGPQDETFELTAGPRNSQPAADTATPMFAYENTAPGPELRAMEGDVVRVTLDNQLPESSTIHWHGIPVANPMDGVPNLTQAPVEHGSQFEYTFRADPPGTYFYHSHSGLQLDQGLSGPLVVQEANPHVEYDAEYVILLDDYLPGEPSPPEHGSTIESDSMGGMGGMMNMYRPPYAGMTMNGHLPAAAPTFEITDGDRVRLRFINASSATPFRVQAGGHAFDISHADGRPVDPVTVDSFDFGPGERYDAIVTAENPGSWQLTADALRGPTMQAAGVLQYAGEADTSPIPPSGGGRSLEYDDLVAVDSLEVTGTPDRRYELTLGPSSEGYGWAIDGQTFPDSDPLPVTEGEHVQIRLQNRSPVSHPMHLHGHFFEVGDAVKDTVQVPGHMGSATIDFRADNPGNWFFHCHNLYHLEAGMARVLTYV